jgi:uncharacterized protein YndB with AHSA1/START domain
MKDGELLQVGGRYELRFERSLHHPVSRVWHAITTPAGLAAWFPFDVVGDRATGAPLTFVFREGEADDFSGVMVEYTPQSAMELRWGDDETVRLELAPSSAGCVLRLINRFDEIGKAARDAAGWHTCLDALEASLDGMPVSGSRWAEVHPGYVERFGPEASVIGPPGTP